MTTRRRRFERPPVVVADAERPPFIRRGWDLALLDAPCSGLGALRRRPDARWRIERSDIDTLVSLQRRMLEAAADLAVPLRVDVGSGDNWDEAH